MKAISKLLWIIIVLGMCGIALDCWVIHVNNQQALSLMTQYNELRAKPYVTLQENKKIFNQANMPDSYAVNVIKKMDGTTAVNNKNGHEYLVNTLPRYKLVAKINGKNAVINKAWLKEHRKE